jgi:preprotein translocase YajC subunit
MPALVLAAVTFLLMWVLFILPQQRRIKAHRTFVATLAVDDEVVTQSGMLGRIVEVDGEIISLEIAPDVVARFARGAIAARPGDERVPVPSATAADRAVDPPVDAEPVEPDSDPEPAEK